MSDKYKPLPSNSEAEHAILGGIILNNESFESVSEMLVAGDFYTPIGRLVFSAMSELFNASRPIDPISLGDVLKRNGTLESIGSVSTITELTYGIPQFLALDYYIKLVKQSSVSRNLLKILYRATKDIDSDEEDIGTILERTEADLLKASVSLHSTDKAESKGFFSLAEIVPDLHEHIERYHQGISSGTPTGMKEVDDLLDGGGLQNGSLYVLAAAEKTGKTSIVLDWAYNIARFQKKTVPIITMEMSKLTMTKRVYSSHIGVPYYAFKPGIDGKYYEHAINGLADFSEIPIHIADHLHSVDQISRHLRREVEQGHKAGTPVGMAVIDYLQLMTLVEKVGNRSEEVSRISRMLKLLASELDIPIVTISSLNRVGMSEGQEPDTFNLRDSGTIAFDAEAVFFLHDPSYHPGKPYEHKTITDMVLILARQRNGPTGRIKVKRIGPYMQFMTEGEYNKRFSGDDGIPKTQSIIEREQQSLSTSWDMEDDDDGWG